MQIRRRSTRLTVSRLSRRINGFFSLFGVRRCLGKSMGRDGNERSNNKRGTDTTGSSVHHERL
jgi:hypothetical protein